MGFELLTIKVLVSELRNAVEPKVHEEPGALKEPRGKTRLAAAQEMTAYVDDRGCRMHFGTSDMRINS